MLGPAQDQMVNIAEFSSLKILDIHNHFLFAGVPEDQRSMDQEYWTSFHTLDFQLSERLPICLEYLQVSLLA